MQKNGRESLALGADALALWFPDRFLLQLLEGSFAEEATVAAAL